MSIFSWLLREPPLIQEIVYTGQYKIKPVIVKEFTLQNECWEVEELTVRVLGSNQFSIYKSTGKVFSTVDSAKEYIDYLIRKKKRQEAHLKSKWIIYP